MSDVRFNGPPSCNRLQLLMAGMLCGVVISWVVGGHGSMELTCMRCCVAPGLASSANIEAVLALHVVFDNLSRPHPRTPQQLPAASGRMQMIFHVTFTQRIPFSLDTSSVLSEPVEGCHSATRR